VEYIEPIARGQRYEDPLEIFLARNSIGELDGGGTQLGDSPGIEFVDVAFYLRDSDEAISLAIDELGRLGAPFGSELQFVKNGRSLSRGFGSTECLGVFLDGATLPKEVYEQSDVNVTLKNLTARLIEQGLGDFRSHWRGNRETALFFYGPDAGAMKAAVMPVLLSDPLCQNARLVVRVRPASRRKFRRESSPSKVLRSAHSHRDRLHPRPIRAAMKNSRVFLFASTLLAVGAIGSLTLSQASTSNASALQVANPAANSVTFYPFGQGGNVAPTGTIAGSRTQLNQPERVWPIQGVLLYVVNRGSNAITGYAAKKTGNAAPTVTIAGSETMIDSPSSLQLDASQAIWVLSTGNNAILKFAPGANGNVAPVLRIAGPNTRLSRPESLHIAFRSGEILVANVASNSIEVFAKNSSGDVAPARVIAGSKTRLNRPAEAELDSSGHIWIANNGGHNVLEFATDANGNVAPLNVLTIAAGSRFNPYGLALDPKDNMAVSDPTSNTIYEFSAQANTGRVIPMAVLRGAKTGLAKPAALSVPQPLATPIPHP
jgi:sugar lactone lactonase YvrE